MFGFSGRIVISQALDYDGQAVYTIPVTVEGLGLTTTKPLTINIVSVNEPHEVINLPDVVNISAATVKAGDQVSYRTISFILLLTLSNATFITHYIA